VPRYAKFLKELCTAKRKLKGNKSVSVGKNVSVVFQMKLPPKYKDPGVFSIPCKIRNLSFDRGVLDLGASINVMPRSIYDKLHLGELVIQLAYRSSTCADGVLEDVLVQVNELVFLADFYVLCMGDACHDVPILLGRPFLKIFRTKIDVHAGTLTMEFDGEIIKFNIFDAMRFPANVNYLCALDVIDELSQDVYELFHDDELLTVLIQGLDQFVFHNMPYHINNELVVSIESLLKLHVVDRPRKLELPESHMKMPLSRISPLKLELKPLPENLKYTYLGDDETLSIIIFNALTSEQEDKLIMVLREYSEALGWTLVDLKGLSRTLCSHKITLESDAKLSRKEFQVGEKVLLFNSKLRLFPSKLNSRWLGPFMIVQTYPHGAVGIKSFAINKIFKVNGHRLKHFCEGDQICLVEEIQLEDP